MGVNLGTTRKMILMSLADSVNGNLRDLVCWPSLARIARLSGCNRKTVMVNLQAMERDGLIRRMQLKNQTTRYFLLPDNWPSAREPDSLGNEAPQSIKFPRVGNDVPQGRESDSPNPVREPVREPVKETVMPKIVWKVGDMEGKGKIINHIYQSYPRKVGRAAALAAIEKAIRNIYANGHTEDACSWLLSRVRDFAKSDSGKAGKYCPHPASWMNSGRYDDDNREWLDNSQGTPVKPDATDYTKRVEIY